MKSEVEEAWKDLNEAMLRPFTIPKPLLDRILNLAHVSTIVRRRAMKEREAPAHGFYPNISRSP